MDLTHLRTFVAVAQEGHLTRAAERLHISQPAASTHIRALERDLDVVLFARTNRGLELTAAGRRLADSAERVLAASIELASLARELRGAVEGTLFVGTNADPSLSKIGTLVSRLRERHPLLQLNLQMRSSLATKQGIRAGELDAGFLLGARLEAGLSGAELQLLGYRITGPAAWAATLQRGDWNAVAALPWVTTAAGTSNQEMREALFRAHGLEVNPAIETNNDVLIRQLVKDGVGVGLIRDDHALQGERDGYYATSPLARAQTWLRFVHLEARAADPVIDAISSLVQTLWPASERSASPSATETAATGRRTTRA